MGPTREDLGAAGAQAERGAPRREVPCASCGSMVDMLRAPQVAYRRGSFRYFCSLRCRSRYAPEANATPLAIPHPRRKNGTASDPFPISVSIDGELLPIELPDPTKPIVPSLGQDREPDQGSQLESDLETPPEAESAPPVEPAPSALPGLPAPPHRSWALTAIAVALTAVGLTLAGSHWTVTALRVGCVWLAAARLVVELYRGINQSANPPRWVQSSASAISLLVATLAAALQLPEASGAINLCATIVAATLVSRLLIRAESHPQESLEVRLAHHLAQPARRLARGEQVSTPWFALRPGEEILIEAGDIVACDATLSVGQLSVLAWPGAPGPTSKREGQSLLAGAQVLSGRARAVVTWTGLDRTWLRLTLDPTRRVDRHAPISQLALRVAWRGGLVAAALAAIASLAGGEGPSLALLMALATWFSFANQGVVEIPRLFAGRTILEAVSRGISFQSAALFHRASLVSQAAFCARGTLLLGEPEVAVIETTGKLDKDQILALAAGAEVNLSSPASVALARAARARGVRPDAARNAAVIPGLGVSAVSASGERLIVGSRALLLRERISIAATEKLVAELESTGRSALLVALDGRLVGAIGLQDGIRTGARAAVQHLLDVQVEPVMLSGDARETCETMGRTLDIEHVRPELLPADTAKEVQRLVASGNTVAVIGRSPADDEALSAADVSVVLAAAGSPTTNWGIQLASNDVRDAAYALRMAHEYRSESQRSLSLCVAGGILAALATFFGAPPAVVPIGVVGGVVLGLAGLKRRALPKLDRSLGSGAQHSQI